MFAFSFGNLPFKFKNCSYESKIAAKQRVFQKARKQN